MFKHMTEKILLIQELNSVQQRLFLRQTGVKFIINIYFIYI